MLAGGRRAPAATAMPTARTVAACAPDLDRRLQLFFGGDLRLRGVAAAFALSGAAAGGGAACFSDAIAVVTACLNWSCSMFHHAAGLPAAADRPAASVGDEAAFGAFPDAASDSVGASAAAGRGTGSGFAAAFENV